ncbi:unnamed protein product [Soboliphyme baturini]|uniref:DUF7921 domain-containing protein n=1 Tax=Soboliphyme baturini TaxID=241478 RepID=A0A183I914_9BILA|nr:unnamed protein product [Soboliphyme baturini]
MVPSLFGRVMSPQSPAATTHFPLRHSPAVTPRTRKIFKEPLLKASIKHGFTTAAGAKSTTNVPSSKTSAVFSTANIAARPTVSSILSSSETIFRPQFGRVIYPKVKSISTTELPVVTMDKQSTMLKTPPVYNYSDAFRQCFSYCECHDDLNVLCHLIGCLPAESCKGPVMTHAFGSPNWMKNRGLCVCISGAFVCERPEQYQLREEGIYLFVGYAHNEIQWLSEHVPIELQYRIDLEDPEFFHSVIVGRLQTELKTMNLNGMDCRFNIYFAVPGNLILQIETFAVEMANGSSLAKWTSGIEAKVIQTGCVKKKLF